MSTSDTINALNQRNQQLRQLIEDTKTVGIDIDGVLSDTIAAAIEHIRTRYSYTMQYEKWSHWNPHQIPELANLGKTDEMQPENFFYQFLREDGSPVVRPIEGSQSGIARLKELEKSLIALSGRREASRPYTTGFLGEHFGEVFDQVLLTDHDTPKQVEKYELARQHGIKLMIEDNALYAINLASNGIPTILLEAPWNTGIDTSAYPDIYRVKDWREILEIVK